MNDERIEVNPKIMMGKPIVRGTRIPVYTILNLFAEGYTVDRVVEEYPDLTKEDVAAALKYGARMTHFEELELAKAA